MAATQSVSTYRSASLTSVLLPLTVGLGLAVRFALLGLPHAVVKYGGSALWALSIYWLTSAVTPARHLLRASLLAGGLATSVEMFKLHQTPALDTFRRTLPGVLLLGSHFSMQDVVAYWCAVLVGYMLDRELRRRRGYQVRLIPRGEIHCASTARVVESDTLTVSHSHVNPDMLSRS